MWIHFYSCVLDCQAFEQECGQGWPCYDTNIAAAFQMQITLLLWSLDTGLYHNKVTFSLTLNQRLMQTKYTTVKWPIRRTCVKGRCLINI